MKHETVIPLIGGVAIASENVFGTPPSRIYSYNDFTPNDSHLIEYYKKRNLNVPYTLLDNNTTVKPSKNVDVVSTVCPCAGLSTLSPTSRADSPTNDWMIRTADYVLNEISPQVFWGENAPTLAGDRGKIVRKKLTDIASKNGYTFMVYKTKSLDHGLPQYRSRTFYFFFKEKGKIPEFQYFNKELQTVEELLDSVKGDTQNELSNTKIPTEDPYYKYILEEIHPGMTHAEFVQQLDKSIEASVYITKQGITYEDLALYFEKIGNEKQHAKCKRRHAKLKSGKNIMTKNIYFPRKYTGAFVGHLPKNMTHHKENRFLTYRECMAMMGLPSDFEIINPKRNLNHVCQNVPVSTAMDMAREVKAYLEGKRTMIDADFAVQSNLNKKIQYESNVTLDQFFSEAV